MQPANSGPSVVQKCRSCNLKYCNSIVKTKHVAASLPKCFWMLIMFLCVSGCHKEAEVREDLREEDVHPC